MPLRLPSYLAVALLFSVFLLGHDATAQETESRLADFVVFHGDAQSLDTLIALQPNFSPDVFEYSGVVPADTVRLLGSAIAGSPAQTMTVNGMLQPQNPISVEFDVLTPTIPFDLIVAVTAGDGLTTSTYRIAVVRPPSAGSNLAALEVSAGALSPSFDPNVRAYSATVPKSVSAIAFTPTHADPAGTISVQGQVAVSGETATPIALPSVFPLVNRVEIVSTSADGLSSSPYTIDVTRLKGASSLLADITTAPSGGFDFDPGTSDYLATYDFSVSSLAISLQAVDVDAQLFASVDVGAEQPINTGAPLVVPLKVGDTVILFRVVSEDTTSTSFYRLVARRTQDPRLALVSVASSAQSCCANYPSTPEQTVFDFVATPFQRSVTLTVASTAPAATLSFGGQSLFQSWPVTVDLSVPRPAGNPLSIPLVVTSADGEIAFEYTVRFFRDPSPGNRLLDLVPSASVLSPSFSPNIQDYTLVARVGSALSFVLTAADPASTLTGFGELSGPLAFDSSTPAHTVRPGAQGFVFAVQSESGAVRDYRLLVLGEQSSDNGLQALTFDIGVLNPVFVTGTQSYTLQLPAGVGQVQAQATTVDPFASVTVAGAPVDQDGRSMFFQVSDGGTIPVVVTAESGATRSYTVVVVRPNAPPYIGAPVGAFLFEDGTLTANVRVLDIEAGSDPLIVTATSDNQELITDVSLASGLSGAGENRALRIVPVADQFGTARVQVTVTDAGGLSASAVMAVTVFSINDAPSFDLVVTSVRVPPGALFSMSGAVTNLRAGPLNEQGQQVAFDITITPVDGPVPPGFQARLEPDDGGVLTTLIVQYPANETLGAVDVSLVARDDGGTQFIGIDTSAPQTVRIVGAQQDDIDLQVSIERTLATPTVRAYEVTVANVGTVESGAIVELRGLIELQDVEFRCVTAALSGACAIDRIDGTRTARLSISPGGFWVLEARGNVGSSAFVRVEAAARAVAPALLVNPEDDSAVYEDAIAPWAVFRSGFE